MKQDKKELIMAEKVTVQDIADAMGLSRNTISKALNNHPQIPEGTKKRVIQKQRR